jgi:ribonuclease BN (tRNA processing enzyme)
MARVTVQFVGSGDAFGSGGRFQPCISVRSGETHVLLDFGASSLTAMQKLGLDPASVDAIVVSHLHGDHFGGIPFFILDAQFRRGTKPLVIAGPPGLRDRVLRAMETFFPGSSRIERKFETRFVEIPARTARPVAAVSVTGYEVPHPSGAPAYALRVECGGKIIAYSGDGEWSEALVEAARGADLFICEAYYFEKIIRNHLSYATLRRERARLECRRLILTHMSADMLARQDEVGEAMAYDGLAVSL